MKFSIVTLTLALIAVAQSGVVSYDDGKNKHHDDDDNGIITLQGKFALAVKEFDGKHGKGYGKKKFDLVYEIGDGQLEYGGRKDQIYYPSNFDNGKDHKHGKPKPQPIDDGYKHKYPHPQPIDEGDDNGHKWKRGYDDQEEFRTIKYDSNYYFFTLKNSVLHDKRYATGEIVANHQFQFDDPTQPDALYKKGFSVVYKDGEYLLALKGKTKFWNSAVDDNGVFKIYNAPITEKSEPIELIVIKVEERGKGDGKKW